MQTYLEDTAAIKTHVLRPQDWVKKHSDYLYRYGLKRLNDRELALDLVQETFLAALERMRKFEGRSSERTWLTAILKYKIIDIYRKRSSGLTKLTEMIDASMEEEGFFDADTGHWKPQHQPQVFNIDNYEQLTGKEFQDVLKQCLQKLPALWMSVFTMKHLDEEETNAICDQLKLSPGNYWVIIHRAKVSLRACLQKNWI